MVLANPIYNSLGLREPWKHALQCCKICLNSTQVQQRLRHGACRLGFVSCLERERAEAQLMLVLSHWRTVARDAQVKGCGLLKLDQSTNLSQRDYHKGIITKGLSQKDYHKGIITKEMETRTQTRNRIQNPVMPNEFAMDDNQGVLGCGLLKQGASTSTMAHWQCVAGYAWIWWGRGCWAMLLLHLMADASVASDG